MYNKSISNLNAFLIHWNCNSINKKIDEFKHFLNLHKPCFVTLNETKMNSKRAEEKLNFSGYITFHRHKKDNKKNGAGGVAILVRTDLACERDIDLDWMDLEVISVTHSKLR